MTRRGVITLGLEQVALFVQHVNQGPCTHFKTGRGRFQCAFSRNRTCLQRLNSTDACMYRSVGISHLPVYLPPRLVQALLGCDQLGFCLAGSRVHTTTLVERHTQ